MDVRKIGGFLPEANALAVPRRVLALKTSQDEYSSLQAVEPNSRHPPGRFTGRHKTFGAICSGAKTSQEASIRSLPRLCEVGADLQDVTRCLGAFALEPRRHKTLPYAASPDYAKFKAVIKSAATVSFLLRLSAKGCVIRTRIFAFC